MHCIHWTRKEIGQAEEENVVKMIRKRAHHMCHEHNNNKQHDVSNYSTFRHKRWKLDADRRMERSESVGETSEWNCNADNFNALRCLFVFPSLTVCVFVLFSNIFFIFCLGCFMSCPHVCYMSILMIISTKHSMRIVTTGEKIHPRRTKYTDEKIICKNSIMETGTCVLN